MEKTIDGPDELHLRGRGAVRDFLRFVLLEMVEEASFVSNKSKRVKIKMNIEFDMPLSQCKLALLKGATDAQ